MKWRSGKALLLALLCCFSFLTVSHFLKKNRQRSSAAEDVRQESQLRISPSVINAPLPDCDLINKLGSRLSEEQLRADKVMLVLVTASCSFCFEEADFLRSRIAYRNDIRFYGIVPFGAESDLATVEHRFPFELYFDKGGRLRDALGINGVPVKLYLENGVVKQIWLGSTTAQRQEQDFDEWLQRGL